MPHFTLTPCLLYIQVLITEAHLTRIYWSGNVFVLKTSLIIVECLLIVSRLFATASREVANPKPDPLNQPLETFLISWRALLQASLHQLPQLCQNTQKVRIIKEDQLTPLNTATLTHQGKWGRCSLSNTCMYTSMLITFNVLSHGHIHVDGPCSVCCLGLIRNSVPNSIIMRRVSSGTADHSATFEGNGPIPYPVVTAQESSSIV